LKAASRNACRPICASVSAARASATVIYCRSPDRYHLAGVRPQRHRRHRAGLRLEYTRRTRTPSGDFAETRIQDYAFRRYLEQGGRADALPSYFVNAQMLSPDEHLRMQAAVQPFVMRRSRKP